MGTVTVGSNTYEIYGEKADADAYLAVVLSASTYNGMEVDQQTSALVMASRFMDRLRWKGTKTVDSQPIEWPRDGTGVDGHADGDTPPEVFNGFWELAAKIAEDPELTNNRSQGSNIQRVKGGEAEAWFFRSTLDDETKLPVDVLDWVRDYLDIAGQVLAVDSGTFDGEFQSVFDARPERVKGVF